MSTMASTRVSSVFVLAISLIVIVCMVDANNEGFSVGLIHRDSSSSPFYNPGETQSERVGNAVRRSVSRVTRFANIVNDDSPYLNSAPTSPVDPLVGGNGEYLMNISLGSPPFSILAIADTGSDVMWTQCKPCRNCYRQDAPVFDPKFSTTYRPVSCSSAACTTLSGEGSFCPAHGDICQYEAAYGDGSKTEGDIATETLTLGTTTHGATMAFPNTVFGCGHENTGTFDPRGSGIIGLGKGPASLISQLGSTAGGKFSYCMVPYITPNQTTSTMHFGQNAVVSGPNVVNTPLLSSNLGQTFYALDLEFVSVGRTIIPFDGPSFSKNAGNIIIDSGTTLTIVPTHFLSEFSTALEAQVTGANRTSDPQGLLSLCYVASDSMEFPDIVMHFKGGDVALTPVNLFYPMSDTVICLAFYGNDDVSIYGNLAQQDFLVGYDLQKRTVSFKHTDCTKN
ncbi:Aspartic proteinase CDR1 [Linum perenne]